MKRFTITKKEGMTNMEMVILLMQFLLTLKDGIYDVIVEDHHTKATNKQFGWLWGGIYTRLIPELNKEGYDITSTKEVDKMFETMFRNRNVVNRNTGEVIKIPQSLSEMNTVEMSEYCDRLLDFCMENFKIDIHELLPDQYRKTTKNS